MNTVALDRAAAFDFDHMPRAELTDDGGRPLDAILCATENVALAVRAAVAQGYAVMPAGGLTSAINSFAYDRAAVLGKFRDVVAIRPRTAITPQELPPATPLSQILSHQFAIDRALATISVGAGITYTQANTLLAEAVGPNARLLIDLTSIGSALAGGVVATGGMGPLRLPPSATLDAVAIADGSDSGVRLLKGAAAAAIEGLQGWNGMVTAVRLRYFEVPPAEFGLVLPMQSSDVDAMATLIAHLHPWTQIALPEPGGRLAGDHAENTLLNGIELISREALEMFVEQAADPAKTKALGLLQSCEYANADLLACLTGWSNVAVEDVLGILMDEDSETIGGVMIDFGVGFSSGAEMESFRAIREGAPDTARSRARVTPPGKLKPWSVSTDVNIAAPADSAAIAAILAAYDDYRAEVGRLAAEFAGRVEISLSTYGHLSPRGIDPHHRVTLIGGEGREADFDAARAAVLELKRALLVDLLAASESHGCTVTGGEKGMPSVIEIMRAAGGDNRAPEGLRRLAREARAILSESAPAFTFRSPPDLTP